MKNIIISFLLLVISLGPCKNVIGQSDEAQQLLLNVQKLAQLKSILNNLYKGYEIVSKGYNTIKDLSRGNFNLHKQFIDRLSDVSPVVKNYKRVGDIITCQIRIVSEYKSAFLLFKSDPNFDDGEIKYLSSVYSSLFDQSIKNIEDLAIVITANKLRMSDEERLSAIDRIYGDIVNKLEFLRHFNSKTTLLALQHSKERNDIGTIRNIYGIK